MTLMKLQLASLAALMLAAAALSPAGVSAAGLPGTSTTQCVPVRIDNRTVHQHCTVTHTWPDGSITTSEYWIDQNGTWYIPAN